MRFFAVRPKRRQRRKRTKIALYTVAFNLSELRRHDSSFDYFCKNHCEYNCSGSCGEICNEKGEYGRLLYIWCQQGYLMRFFTTFRHLINTDRYGNIDIKEAITRHKLFLVEVEDYLLRGDLSKFFISLYKNPSSKEYHSECKFKSHLLHPKFENWIRIYAVKYKDNDSDIENYIITGGAIKLVEKMSESAVVEYEEQKQDIVIKYLIDNNLATREEIEKLIL